MSKAGLGEDERALFVAISCYLHQDSDFVCYQAEVVLVVGPKSERRGRSKRDPTDVHTHEGNLCRSSTSLQSAQLMQIMLFTKASHSFQIYGTERKALVIEYKGLATICQMYSYQFVVVVPHATMLFHPPTKANKSNSSALHY